MREEFIGLILMKDANHESSYVGRNDLDVEGPTLFAGIEKSGVDSEDRERLWEATEDPALFLTNEPAKSQIKKI